jgi:hypothetical protein
MINWQLIYLEEQQQVYNEPFQVTVLPTSRAIADLRT